MRTPIDELCNNDDDNEENWETSNTSLWLNNDEGAYKEVSRICSRHSFNYEMERILTALAKEIIPASEGIDYNKVNWEQIYNDFNED